MCDFPQSSLHNQIELSRCLDDFIELNHIRVPDLLQDLDLPRDSLDVLLVVDLVFLEDFDGDLFSSESVLTELTLPEGTFAEMLA